MRFLLSLENPYKSHRNADLGRFWGFTEKFGVDKITSLATIHFIFETETTEDEKRLPPASVRPYRQFIRLILTIFEIFFGEILPLLLSLPVA